MSQKSLVQNQTSTTPNKNSDFWLMPEGVNVLTPQQSQRLNEQRNTLLSLYKTWGYDYVITPMVEFIEPLLNGATEDLKLQTQKVTDQLSGRLMGFRADMTSQIARLDVRTLNAEGVARYCYADTVYHTRPKLSPEPTRLPFQVGVELFGHSGVASDYEVIALMLESLMALNIKELTLDLGHIGILEAIFIEFDSTQHTILRGILSRKCVDDLMDFSRQYSVSEAVEKALIALMQCVGQTTVLDELSHILSIFPSALAPLQHVRKLATSIQRDYPEVNLYIDLSETRGFGYHSGCVFAAYTPSASQMVAKGGRYDGFAAGFGRERPATGFTLDLQQIAVMNPHAIAETSECIVVEYDVNDAALMASIKQLRAAGRCVVNSLGKKTQLLATHTLVNVNNEWQVQAI